MSTLNTQVWVNQIQKNLYPAVLFLNYAKKFDEFVNADIINIADAGFDPAVLINNTTYPIAITEREDTNRSFELDLFETENTLVSYPKSIEFSYDKMESVIYGHRMALQTKIGMKAAHAYAPQSDTANTPVIATTGEDNGDGYKRIRVEDILKLKRRYDMLDIPQDKRFLVLDPRHTEDLILFDLKAFKDITDFANGMPKRFAGFNVLEFTKNPTYNATTGQKKAFGTVPASTDAFCSFAFSSDEVMRADGTMKMYERANDPELRGTIIGFDKRFIAMPIRNKGVGAIISAKTV